MTSHPAGAVIGGRYEIVRTLGRGGFGHTFLARERTDGTLVAVKVLDVRRAEDWKAFELFEREAVVLRSLRHHGIPAMHQTLRDRWEGADAAFLVMEYIEGTSLAAMIEERRSLAPSEVLHLFLELIGILDYLHGRAPPILHRDIKPANIIVRSSGMPALVDFGVVRNVFKPPAESGSTVAGTYGYMPYEQYMGQASPASDLFSLGATFLHLVTGRPPPEFMNEEGRIAVPESLPGDERLRGVIARMLLPSPADRFQSAREVREALLAAAPPAPVEMPRRPLPAVVVRHAAPALPPVPRALEGVTRAHFDRVAPGPLDMMSGSEKVEGVGVWDVVLLVFFSIITAGVLPAVFVTMSRARRRRLKVFFKDGVQATAEILEKRLEDTAFGEKLAKVSYQFEADGALHRDADQVLPVIADRWRVGDQIQILYIAERGYDSVIISG
jgi:hypothetical protein